MQKLVRDYLNELNKKQKKRRKAGIAAVMLVVLVVGAVMGTLTQYGVAMTGDAKCGLEEHQHSEACYTRELICGLEESEGHTHTDACRYPAELVCGLEESAGEDGTEGHTHSDACYAAPDGWACGVEESEGHIHTDDCYSSRLSCDIEEHTHSDACYGDPDNDPNADVENADVWNAQYADVEWTDSWGDNLAAAARVQLGYRESEKNYTEAEDGSHKGYTRYGQFVDDVYRDYWDTAFVNFCVYYAGLTDTNLYPNEMNGARSERYPEGLTDAAKWQEEFLKINEQNEKALVCLAEAAGYEPKAGDLVFFEKDKVDGSGEKENRMGVVSSYNNENGELKVIEGDSENQVKENIYGAGDNRIVNYLKITELEKEYKATLGLDGDNGGEDEDNGAAEEEDPSDITEETTQEPEDQPEDKKGQNSESQPEDKKEQNSGTQPEDGTDEEQDSKESDSLMTLEELENLPEDEVGATIWRQQRRARMFRMAVGRGWSFDAYYVNEEGSYDVTKTKDFSLKYQMEFRSGNSSLPIGAVEIRIPATIYRLRDTKEDVIPTDIAVPQIKAEDKNDETKWISSKTSPFNCYIEENVNGEKELVFFNYKAIGAGTNAAWQVLYKNQKIMEIPDESTWKLNPTIQVTIPSTETDEDGNPTGEPTIENGETDSLTGRVDSKVDITQVTKEPYNKPGKKYTPGLYTKSQVEGFITGEVDGKYLKEDGTLNTDDYRYAVWTVQIKGTASQPFDLLIDESTSLRRSPSSNSGTGLLNGGITMMALGGNLGGLGQTQYADGEVVGIRDNSNRSLGYGVTVKPEKMDVDAVQYYRIVENCKEKDWGCRFYVVTAYSTKNLKELESFNDILYNDIFVMMNGVDKDSEGMPYEMDSSRAFANWTYVDYKWTYSGDLLEVKKSNNPYYETKEESARHKKYTGWLKAYQMAKDKGEDYGNLPYYTTGNFYGYPLTHVQSPTGQEDVADDGFVGTYKEGTYYELTTVDDFMYAYSSEKGPTEENILGSDDYYYSGITVTQTDMGYDIWEDQEDEPKYEDKGVENLDRSVKIYVMKENKTEWEHVATVRWDKNKNTQTYTFAEEELQEWKPWRVKVVHAATDYRTTCKIDVNVNLRHNSAKLAALIGENGQGESQNTLVLEDISGIYGKFYKNGELAAEYPTEQKDGNYSEPGLETATNELYKSEFVGNLGKTDSLLQRDSAFKDLSGLGETAQSVKRSRSINDADNSRSLVEYYLTAFDGYEISRTEDYEYLKSAIPSPGRKQVAFYDLLPYGMHFDPSFTVTAGRIKSLETNRTNADKTDPRYQTSRQVWDKNQIKVTTEFQEDYQGTGRTMVIFHIEYTGADSSIYSETDGMWWQGWGVNFRAYYEWKNLNIIQETENISAFMTDKNDPTYGDPANPLHGKEGEVYNDDGNLEDMGATDQENYKYFYEKKAPDYGGIDGDLRNDSFPSVLFASNKADTDVAVSAQTELRKRVRADDDMFNDYDLSAVVEPGRGYTYEITTGMSKEMEEVVVYDILEDKKNLCADNESIYGDDAKTPWQGTFQSIVTSGLEDMGITPEIYYRTTLEGMDLEGTPNWGNDSYQAGLQAALGSVETLEAGVKDGTWKKYTDDFTPNPDHPVKAIAVVLRKSMPEGTTPDEDGFGASGSEMTYASFQIKMLAPQANPEFNEETQSVYAYNNPLCYTKYNESVQGAKTGTLPGNAVKVRLKVYETLELEKEYEGDVPDAVKKKNPSFEFRLSETGEDGTVKYLANREYELKVKKGNKWESQPGLHATDGNGYLELHADEKAVFKVADASAVKVEETKNLFWYSTQETEVMTEGDTEAEIGGSIKVKNKYRPVLYVQKKLQNVPDSKTEEVMDEEFTFQIWEDGKNPEEEGYSGVYEYYLVDSVRTDGGIPEIESGPFETDAKGQLTIKQGEIVALFPGPEGTKYHLKEVVPQEPIVGDAGNMDGKWNWICGTSEIVDTIPAKGDSKTINNNYRWKDLYLTKELTHQNPEECTQEFTFKIEKLVPNLLDEAREAVNGNRWVLMERNADGDLVEAKDSDGEVIEGVLGPDSSIGNNNLAGGTLTCACAGKVIKIEGLEAGETYVVTETQSGERYTAVNPSEEVKMPVYSSSADVKITNDYRMRSLSVSKEVIKGGTEEGGDDSEKDESFIMEVKVGGELLKNKSYILKKKDGTIITQENGNDLKTNNEGRFTIKDGETATFENVGTKGTEFEVKEITDDQQVYPADKASHTGTLSDEDLTDNVKTAGSGNISRYGSGVAFRNGSDDILIISKEYRCADEDKEWLEKLYEIEMDRAPEMEKELEPSQFAVTVCLKATKDGQEFNWKDAIVDGEILLLSDDGEKKQISFDENNQFTLEPWQQIVIPVTDALRGVRFTVEEVESPEGVLEFTEKAEGDTTNKYLCLVSKEEPIKTGTFGVDQTAVVYNRVEKIELQDDPVVKLFAGTLVNGELPGGNLVWRLQKFENGEWKPAADARYMIYDTLSSSPDIEFRDVDLANPMENDTEDNNQLPQKNQRSLGDSQPGGQIDRSLIRKPRSTEILKTDGDGRIILTRREPSVEYTDTGAIYYLPTVYFLDEELKDVKVSLNAGETGMEGEYRLIEDMEESDDAWGMLVACGKDTMKKHKCFRNTTTKVSVEIGKKMEDDSRPSETFTMILKQVTKYKEEDVKDGEQTIRDPEKEVTEITESYPVKEVPYILCTVDPATGEVTETGGETGPNGEIYLRAGQYVKLELPEDTKWTVEEEITNPFFELVSLTPESQKKGTVTLTKWTPNLMLIEIGRSQDVNIELH